MPRLLAVIVAVAVLVACQQRPETSLEPSIMYRKPCSSAQQLVVTNKSGEPVRVFGLPEGDPAMPIAKRGGLTEFATLFSPIVDTLDPPPGVFAYVFAVPLDRPFDVHGDPRIIRGVNVRCVPRDTSAASRPTVIENPPALR